MNYFEETNTFPIKCNKKTALVQSGTFCYLRYSAIRYFGRCLVSR